MTNCVQLTKGSQEKMFISSPDPWVCVMVLFVCFLTRNALLVNNVSLVISKSHALQAICSLSFVSLLISSLIVVTLALNCIRNCSLSEHHGFSSVRFNGSVVSDSLRPHGPQHARPPCPSPTPSIHSNSCPSSQWCHPAISCSVVPFSSCPPSLPVSVFSNESTICMRWPEYWSFSFSIIPSKNTQDDLL